MKNGYCFSRRRLLTGAAALAIGARIPPAAAAPGFLRGGRESDLSPVGTGDVLIAGLPNVWSPHGVKANYSILRNATGSKVKFEVRQGEGDPDFGDVAANKDRAQLDGWRNGVAWDQTFVAEYDQLLEFGAQIPNFRIEIALHQTNALAGGGNTPFIIGFDGGGALVVNRYTRTSPADTPVRVQAYRNSAFDETVPHHFKITATPNLTAGALKVELDGATIVDLTGIQLGYPNDTGVYPEISEYRAALTVGGETITQTDIVTFWNLSMSIT